MISEAIKVLLSEILISFQWKVLSVKMQNTQWFNIILFILLWKCVLDSFLEVDFYREQNDTGYCEMKDRRKRHNVV